jgi:hypothetical protein
MTSPNQNLGNSLNKIVRDARHTMFDQGELAQLTYGAFDIAAKALQEQESEEIKVTFPVGYKPDRTPIQSTRMYRKDQLLTKYQYLAVHQLTVNTLIHLVTLVETMLGDVVRLVVVRYPQKLSGKRNLPIQAVLESTSLEEVHLRATDALLNELTYKSPADFAEAIQPLLSINLLECPAFHKYVEVKATRDIFVHNSGISNDVYIRKAGSHVRAKAGTLLPADIDYFLESYENCLQVADWLELELHNHWHSSDYEDRNQKQLPLESPTDPIEISTQ